MKHQLFGGCGAPFRKFVRLAAGAAAAFVLCPAAPVFAEGNASGDFADVTGVIVNSITDGRAPYDADDSAGNDSSGDNRIVRTFDSAVYSLEFVTNMQAGTGKRSLSEAVVNIRMSIPGAKGDYRWDTDNMGWLMPGYTVSYDDGHVTLDGKVKLSQVDGADPVPGTAAVNVYLVASGVAHGAKVEPTFSVWMDGDPEGSAKAFTCDSAHTTADGKPCTLTVSADASRFGVYLATPTQQRWGYLNPDTGKLTLDSDKPGYSPCAIASLGMAFYLKGEEGKGVKGCEVPKGDITFILDPEYTKDDVNWQRAQMWDSLNLYRRGEYAEDGILCSPGTTYGRETQWATSYGSGPSNDAYVPYFPTVSGNRLQNIFDPGECKFTKLPDGRYQVTVSDYHIDGVFPKYNRYRTPAGNVDFTEETNIFTAFGAQLYCPLDSGEPGQSRRIRMTVKGLAVTGVSGRPMSSFDGETSWSVSGVATTSCTEQRNIYGMHRYTSSGFQGADRYESSTFDGLVCQRGGTFDNIRLPLGSNTQDTDCHTYAADILLKFDDQTLGPLPDGKSMIRLSKNGGYPNGAKDFRLQGRQYEGTHTMLYGVKPDGKGWAGLDECKRAKISDLKYYATWEEACAHGTVVGFLYEMRDMDYAVRGWWDNYVDLQVKADAPIGRVGFVTCTSRTWNGKRADMASEVQPGSNLDGKATGWTLEALMSNYVPRTFSGAEDGYWYNRESGNLGTGACVLVVGEMPKASLASDVAGKSWWNLNAGERIMDMRLDLTVDTAGDSQATAITVTHALDQHLHYVKGSGVLGGTYVPADGAAPSKVVDGEAVEPSVSKNGDGQEVLTWKISGTSGESFPAVHFQLEIGTELDPKTDVNELDNPLTQTVQCKSTYGPETGEVSWMSRVIKSPAVSMQLRPVGASTIEQDGDAVWRVVLSNNGAADSKPFNQYLVLPYGGDNRDSKYSGDPELVSMVLDTSHGKRTLASGLKVYVTMDTAVQDGKFDAQGLDALGVSWTEVPGSVSGDTVTYTFRRKGVTAVKFSGNMLGGHEGLNYQLTLTPGDGCSPGDLYSLSASVYGERFPGTVFAAPTPVQVVSRTVSGDVFNDRDKSGLYNGDKDLHVGGQRVRILDASGKQAKDAFGRDVPDCVTGEDGKWSFTGMLSGAFTVALVDPDGKYELVKNGPDYSRDAEGARKALTELDNDARVSGGSFASDGRTVWDEDVEAYASQEYTFLPAAEMNPAVQEYGNVRFGLAVYWSDLTIEKVADKPSAVPALGCQVFHFKADGIGWDGKPHTYYFQVEAADKGGGSGSGEAPHADAVPVEGIGGLLAGAPDFATVLEGRQTLRLPSGYYTVSELTKDGWAFLDHIAVNGTVDGDACSMDLLLNEQGLVHTRDYRTGFGGYRDAAAEANDLK